MLNNPNQEIRTDYQVTDVFKSTAANQLTRSIVYDFVITQELYDKYVEAHSDYTTLDVGSLIASNIDGTDNSWTGDTLSDHKPLNIYIAARTDKALLFNSRLYSPEMLDVTTDSDTENLVNIYSAYPFEIDSIAGGMNIWTTPTNAVTIKNTMPSQSGIIRIGTCALLNPYDFGDREDVQVICTSFIANRDQNLFKFTINPQQSHVENGYRPALVMAEWMNSTTTKDRGYSIESNTTSKPGLWQQIDKSLKLGTIPELFEQDGSDTYIYKMSKAASNNFVFTNDTTRTAISISFNGTITRTSMGGSENIVELINNTDVLARLSDEAVTIVTMPTGVDYIAQIQEILGNGISPVIEFSAGYEIVGFSMTCFAHLCNIGECGYMFSTFVPYLGHRYICVRYTSTSQITDDLKITMSANNISIGSGEIIS